jgi:hypothetical protein
MQCNGGAGGQCMDLAMRSPAAARLGMRALRDIELRASGHVKSRGCDSGMLGNGVLFYGGAYRCSRFAARLQRRRSCGMHPPYRRE